MPTPVCMAERLAGAECETPRWVAAGMPNLMGIVINEMAGYRQLVC